MISTQTNSGDFLREVYEKLEFAVGVGYYQLADTTLQPGLAQVSWLEQARDLDAESIFFVGDYPTVLFFKCDTDLNADTEAVEDEIRQLHLRVWNTSRVPLFFVALPGELRVYSAYQKPAPDLEEWDSQRRYLEIVKDITQVAETLHEFSRSEIESGRLFQRRSENFDHENRVDQWLLKNLRLLRQKLEDPNGKKREYVHALIGRSIFIRYLEDRKVLVEDYFADEDVSRNGKYRCYADVLSSKEDTYQLFYKLNEDFNGDLFPLSYEEKGAIQESDLHLLQDFLSGRSMGDQPDLLFWAYQFHIIPIELISNIYEEFYHEHGGREDKGTHYTPTTLVDFVLTECLTEDRLDAGARVLDPACGSGIFLVEAYKRMVYHECQRQGVGINQLPREVLIKLLKERIVGIDVNKFAVQIAAFSLYLAFLDFREPPDIRRHKQLPKLVYEPDRPDSGKNLFPVNAFCLTPAEHDELRERIEQKGPYAGRAKDIRMLEQDILPLEEGQFDVIIGNPPWGSASIKSPDEQSAVEWCQAFRYPVGDRELSQCFIWRTQRLLKLGGEIGLLVSTGVLFKHQAKSKALRQRWLRENHIRAVYNFAHVRHVYFRKQRKEAIAPFAAVFFTPVRIEESLQNRITYISIKRGAFAEHLQAVVIDKTDLHKARQSEFLENDWLWKTYMWGGGRDAELIGELESCYPPIRDFVSIAGRGFGDLSLNFAP
ncbi:MAG: N-6 DNA methylase [Chloroflexi bacterium]|nr:N-6 DNA methylase [Chloroflexota bacterium]